MDGTMSEIRGWGPSWAPRNWALCQGQLLPIASYNALFSLIGTIYGGDGRTTFGLPDLRGRVLLGSGNGPGLSNYAIGSKYGVEKVTLNQLEIPAHNHAIGGNVSIPVTGTISMSSTSDEGSNGDPTGRILSESARLYSETNTSDGTMAPMKHSLTASGPATGITSGLTGSSQGHINMQPYQVCNYIICLQGIYPSRS